MHRSAGGKVVTITTLYSLRLIDRYLRQCVVLRQVSKSPVLLPAHARVLSVRFSLLF